MITAREIKLNGWQASIQKAIDIASKDTDALYVTVCSDVLDAAANPQGPFDPCGPTSFEVAMMLHEAGKAELPPSTSWRSTRRPAAPISPHTQPVGWRSIL